MFPGIISLWNMSVGAIPRRKSLEREVPTRRAVMIEILETDAREEIEMIETDVRESIEMLIETDVREKEIEIAI